MTEIIWKHVMDENRELINHSAEVRTKIIEKVLATKDYDEIVALVSDERRIYQQEREVILRVPEVTMGNSVFYNCLQEWNYDAEKLENMLKEVENMW